MLSRRIGALVIATVVSLAGCSLSGGDGGKSSATSKELTVVTHDSFVLSDELKKKFSDDTGMTVKFVAPGDAGALVNQLILTKDSPLGDVAYGVDNAFAGRAIDKAVFAAYTSPSLPASAKEYALDTLTPIDRADVCLNIDKQWFAAKKVAAPSNLDDLTKPQYKNLTVLTSPAASSPGLAFLLATIKDKGDGWPAYWQQLKANGVKVVDSWSVAYSTDFSGSEGKGPRPIVLSYSSSPSAEVDKATGQPRTAALLNSCFRQVEYAGVISGAKNPVGAGKFIDFLLSDDVQKSLPESMYVYPINADVALPKQWAKFAPLTKAPHNLSVADINGHRDEWLKQWKALGF